MFLITMNSLRNTEIQMKKLWDYNKRDKFTERLKTREEALKRTFLDFGINDFKLSEEIGEKYIEVCQRKDSGYLIYFKC